MSSPSRFSLVLPVAYQDVYQIGEVQARLLFEFPLAGA